MSSGFRCTTCKKHGWIGNATRLLGNVVYSPLIVCKECLKKIIKKVGEAREEGMLTDYEKFRIRFCFTLGLILGFLLGISIGILIILL